MFSLLGVLNMEGRVWFEENLTRTPSIYYAHKIQTFSLLSKNTNINEEYDKMTTIRG